MRTAALTRVLPLSVLMAGLLLTLVATVNTASRVEGARDRGRQEASLLLDANLAEATERLQAEAERVDTLAASLAALEAENTFGSSRDLIDTLIESHQVFDRGSSVQAIFIRRGQQVDARVSEDAVESRNIPLVEGGLSLVEVGIWNGAYAVAIDTGPVLGAEVVVVVDRMLLVEAMQPSSNGVRADLTGLPVAEPATTGRPDPDVEFETGPRGLRIDKSDGSSEMDGTAQIFGRSVQVSVHGEPGLIASASGRSIVVVALLGILLTAALAAVTRYVVRTIARAEEERDQADLARNAASARFRASFAHSPIGVVELSDSGTIVAVNPRFASQLGFATEELDGSDVLDLVDGEDRPEASAILTKLLDGESDSEQVERRYRNRNGGAVWIRESMNVLVSEDGSRHVLLQAEDVSDERRARAELHRKALFDDLTGLPNRANLIARLNRALEADRPQGEVIAVMFVDLDKFKDVNDTHGHEAGDMLLVEVAERLRRACRSSDMVARLGGDEFVVLCEGIPNDEVAAHTAERFAESLREPMWLRDAEIPVSASIGLVISNDSSSPHDLLRQADQAMYRAKTSGRNQLIRFDIEEPEPLDQVAESSLAVTKAELLAAIDENQFEIHYQPIVHSDSGSVLGCEALVRWRHPTEGMLRPPKFLPQAEKLGLLGEIDRHVLRTGIQAMQEWTEARSELIDWYVIFNLSPTNYDDAGFAAEVARLVEETGVDPHRIILERNETSFVTQTPVAVVTTRDLRSLGVRISLDHFGTGSSRLSEFSALEFDLLKIDRSFVRDATSQQSYVLEALKNMADALDLKVIVEGVETEAELRVVRKAGIELSQGYHLGRPVPADQFLETYQSASGSMTITA